MRRRNLDTQGTGRKARIIAEQIILDAGHLFQPIDGDLDNGIDGYILLRKKVKLLKEIKGNKVLCEDYVHTGKLVGVQVKGVTEIPNTGASSYYVSYADKAKFGVNFFKKNNLDNKKDIWKDFIGPVILIFVELNSKQCWWTDLNDNKTYAENDYCATINIESKFDVNCFKDIKKLGRELFAKVDIPTIEVSRSQYAKFTLIDFKLSAKEIYKKLQVDKPIVNPTLGKIEYSKSGWNHITRYNRGKMSIFNSLFLLNISKEICENVDKFSTVKKGLSRESKRFIKKVDFLTLRANVNFYYRQSAIVQVVLRRIKTFDLVNEENKVPDQIYFHSIYEPFKKKMRVIFDS